MLVEARVGKHLLRLQSGLADSEKTLVRQISAKGSSAFEDAALIQAMKHISSPDWTQPNVQDLRSRGKQKLLVRGRHPDNDVSADRLPETCAHGHIYLSVYLSIDPSIYLSIYLSVHQNTHTRAGVSTNYIMVSCGRSKWVHDPQHRS